MENEKMFSIKDGETMFHVDGFIGFLKSQGMPEKERIKALDELFTILEPAIERTINRKEKEYESNPSIKKQFVKDYKIQDFIPIIGWEFNRRRNSKKDKESPLFYFWANMEASPRVKEKLFNTYHYLTGFSSYVAGAYYLHEIGVI